MVKYLSKFVLEVLPSIVATVVGAYIVAHYINPRAETPKAAMVATAPAGEAKDAADTTGTVGDKTADAKSADVMPADAKPVEAAKAEKVKDADGKAKAAEKTTRPDEKKNAIELARAAIARLHGTTVDAPAAPVPQPIRVPVETARADDGARVAVQAPTPQRSSVVTPVVTTGLAPQPAPATAAAPPLPPPVIVASPYGHHSVGPEAPASIVPVDQREDRASADRPTPPADIPFQRSYDLQAQTAPVEHVSIADHVLSTTKSIFRALTPNSQSN